MNSATSFSEREFRCNQTENYKFKNTSLFTSLKVKKIKNVTVYLIINDVKFNHTNETNKFYIFDVKRIREMCREALGLTEEENDLIRIETSFVYNSFVAMSHYKHITGNIFANSIFSDDLDIHFEVVSKNPPSSIEVVENYAVSDVHRQTYE